MTFENEAPLIQKYHLMLFLMYVLMHKRVFDLVITSWIVTSRS